MQRATASRIGSVAVLTATLAALSTPAVAIEEVVVTARKMEERLVDEDSPNSFLMSEQEFGDFELEFEVKVNDQLNSGCQIRSRGKTEADVDAEAAKSGRKPPGEGGLGRFHGPQVEIEASPGQAGYIYGEATPYGWLSEEPKDEKHSHDYMKNGEWNKFRIVAQGPRIQTWINGNKVADLTHEGIYKTHPKGHIGLQVHGIAKGTGPFEVA